MSLNSFFGDDNSQQPSEEKEKSDVAGEQEKKQQDKASPTVKQPSNYHNPHTFEVGSDMDNIFLLDVQYNSQINGAQCVFYHPPTQSLYRWNDTTGHKPYLLTMMSEDSVKKIDEVYNSPDFVSMEQTKKYMPMEDDYRELTQVYGDNPLAIGGKRSSFRNFLSPAFEANIRYHLNYISDRGLTPGTYYQVKNKDLKPIEQEIDPDIKNELFEAFENESEEEIEMLNEYMPLLFQNIPDILRCAFDIEVGSEEGRLPNTSNPEDPIISIALADSEGRKICWVLEKPSMEQDPSFEDSNILLFDNEREMLEDFFNIIDKYPIVLSFNGDNFDGPYLINRAKKLGMDYYDIPFNSSGNRSDISLDQAIHVDLHLFFRQASIRIYAFGAQYESASLEELASTLLGEGKIQHPEIWIDQMDIQTLVEYNIKDAELTLRLTQFDDNVVLDLMFILMRISKMPLFDFSRTAVSRWLQMWLVYEHRKRNYLIPRKEDILAEKGSEATSNAMIDGKKFQGAIVLDPHPGVWWDVHVLDFASLYPSIIKTRNLSYETILCGHSECKSNTVPELGHYTCTRRIGLFAIVLGFVRDTRVNWFKPRAKDESLPEMDQRINQVIQSSLKVLINAGYGVFGSEAFDFYCPPVAESTTAYARNAIKQTKDFVEEEQGVKVLYGDTDSVFVHKPSEEQVKRLFEWSIDNIGVELGIDYVFRYVVFSDRKKNYFGITKEGNVIVKGLMGKKSNTPKIVRDNFDKILDILRNVKSKEEFEPAKEEIKNTLANMVQRLENRNFEPHEVSIRLTLSKKLSEYTTWTQTVQAATQLLAENPDRNISVGSTLEFIKVEDPVQVLIPSNSSLYLPAGSVQQASVIPVELVEPEKHLTGKPVLDVAESTFSQILNSLGMSWDEVLGIKSLDEFF